jgi:hypothetical protein
MSDGRDKHDGNKDDCAVDFKHDTEGPCTCSECGNQFPMDQLDPSASDPLCPLCQKRLDWEEEEYSGDKFELDESECPLCHGDIHWCSCADRYGDD